MKKIFLIGLKDLKLAFRDRAALMLMLAAPFLLTLGMGFVTGRLGGSSAGSGLSEIPVVIVNQDDGEAAQALVDLFQSDELAGLVSPTQLTDPAAARRAIDADQGTAAVIIPAGFTQSVVTPGASPVQVELYTNPTRPTSAGVIESILAEYNRRIVEHRLAVEVTVTQLVKHEMVPVAEVEPLVGQLTEREAAGGAPELAIRLETVSGGLEPVEFDILAFLAPGMALMFLMFTVSNGGRTLLAERSGGTLPRLLVAPLNTAQVLGGKVFGIFLTGVAQMSILIGGSALLFGLNWGSPLEVIVLVLAAVTGAVGWGMIITALARTQGQAATVGSAVMLIFGILGGGFTGLGVSGSLIQALGKITPNYWGLEGFAILATGGSLADLVEPVAALLVMGALLFAAAVVIITRRGLAQS